jgi:ribosomal protein L29
MHLRICSDGHAQLQPTPSFRSSILLASIARELSPSNYELRALSKADLTKQLEELKQELASLCVQKIAGGSASKLTSMYCPSPVVLIPVRLCVNRLRGC